MKILVDQLTLKGGINLVIVLVLLILGGRYVYRHNVAPNIPLSENKLIDTLGKRVELRDLSGRYVLVSYFQTWCGDCIREIPNIRHLQERVGKDKLRVLLVSDEGWGKINDFKKRRRYYLDYYLSEKSLKELGINVFPTTYLIDPNGKVIMSKLEQFDWDNEEVVHLIK